MTLPHLPWLELAILTPLIGAAWVLRMKVSHVARQWSAGFAGCACVCAVAAWLDFQPGGRGATEVRILGREIFKLDDFSAPLLPLAALLFFLATVATLRSKTPRSSFVRTLISEAIVLALFSSRQPWLVIGLLAAEVVPPWLELRAQGKSARVFLLHMTLFVGLMIAGQTCVTAQPGGQVPGAWGGVLLLAAILMRNGIVPFQCWMTDLFEHATFGTALLFIAPMTGAYAAVRLVRPIAPEWVLHGIGLLSLITAVYASGLALVQREARRFFCHLFLSHSAIALVGLEMGSEIGLTGALCVWPSVSLGLGGLGLTLRALEARRGRLALDRFQGLYDHTPTLAMFFGLTGLASVGFPGTFGFVGTDMIVEGAVESYPLVGVAVVVAVALNGIAVVQTYFRLFSGARHDSSVSLKVRTRERIAVLALAALILLGGFVPQPWVVSRHRAAEEILAPRDRPPTPTTRPPDPVRI